MELNQQEVTRMSKGDPEIAGVLTILLEQNRVLTEQNQQLQAVVVAQAEHIVKLEKRVQEQERQLGHNSHNGSKPPSSDGFRKANNLREPGGKKGAPKGHPGQTLRFCAEPDQIVVHSPHTCLSCHTSLSDVPASKVEARQVFDLPSFTWKVTEHRVKTICCPNCRARTSAPFPKGVNAPVQYGATLPAWTSYLSACQMLPLERISQLFADLTGHGPSEATLLSVLNQMQTALAPVEQQIRQQLLSSPVIHADETGFRTEGSGVWMYTASNKGYTLLTVHKSKRGREAKGKAGNLLQWFQQYKTAILAFLRDVHIPFDNNQAERDIRRVKVKTKVSGSFRTTMGAEQFARIRSVVSTLLKQSRSVLNSLTFTVHGRLRF